MKNKSEERWPDEKVNVKLSICNKCGGIVRVAVEHVMDTKSKNEFMREVFKYNLTVKTQPLLEYREQNAEWCLEDQKELKKTRKVLTEKIINEVK